MENGNWNVVGNNEVRIKFTVPVKARKKWWEFWKKDEAQIAVKELMSKFKEQVETTEGDYFLPVDNSKQ
jgi:hypothetical protein